jgi:hypothetical protein
MTWRIHVEPFTRPLFFAGSRLTRGKTLGVRAVAVDGDGRVLLVRHTYLAGWWLPGGGVDKGETTQAAVVRELREEAGPRQTRLRSGRGLVQAIDGHGSMNGVAILQREA